MSTKRRFLPHPSTLSAVEVLAHLAERQDKSGECWEWTGSRISAGYGQITMGGEIFYVHRLALAVTIGGIPDGLFACHHCDNPPCAKPDHLYAGTQKQNVADAHRRGRADLTTRLRGEDHPHAHPEALVQEVRACYAAGELTKRQVAERFGIPFATVVGWTRGESRGHPPIRVRDGRFVDSGAPCGTRIGWGRHHRKGEDPCAPCLEANRLYMRAWKEARRAKLTGAGWAA